MESDTLAEKSLTVATWNLEWSQPDSPRGRAIRNMLATSGTDVICATEASIANLPEGGHILEAEADYGYPLKPGRRKVILWSKHEFVDTDAIGHPDLPSGRFAAATLNSPIGPVQMIGVCIPWTDAHVRTGRRDRKRWEDHLAYLRALQAMLVGEHATPTILLGDFNQTIPRWRQPLEAANALNDVLDGRLTPLTMNLTDTEGSRAIDHVCHTSDLSGQLVGILPKSLDGVRLSDHFGVVARFSVA